MVAYVSTEIFQLSRPWEQASRSHLLPKPKPKNVRPSLCKWHPILKWILVEEYVRGYPRLAAFESSEPSFSLYRKFKYLHSRVLLELQHEIQCLESDLTSMDEMDYSNGKQDILQSIEIDHRQAKQEGIRRKRTKLVNLIRGKLVHYGKFKAAGSELTWLTQ